MKWIKRRCMAMLLSVCLLATVLPVSVFAADVNDTVFGGVKEVSLGHWHSAAIKEDGSLWMWGSNYYGGLGDGTTTNSYTPVKILEGVKKVSLGQEYSAAIKEDGSLWMWGSNSYGELGDGTTTSRSTPKKILEDVKEVSLGNVHSAAIKEDGSLWMWGRNPYGELGDGTTTNSSTPVKILEDVKGVSLGFDYGAAIKEDGSLWMWGRNMYGELGDGTTTNSFTPVKILEDVKEVSLGGHHSAAIKEDGSLWMWGNNAFGKLGDGTGTDRYIPVKILEGVKEVSLGYDHSAAIKEDGSLWMWGSNAYGRLGDGTTTFSSTPIKILEGVKKVSLGGFCSAVIKEDGSLWLWGCNVDGRLGDGTTEDRYTPICIMGGSGGASESESIDESAYTQEHMDFINSATYADRMNTKWASVISQGLDTPTGKIGEGMYNVLNSASEILSCKSLSIFENPYDAVIADLILDQAELRLADYELKFTSELGENISTLEKLCSMADDSWSLNAEYKTSLEKLIEAPESMKTSNPQFYNLCQNVFQGLLDDNQLDEWLKTYGKASELLGALDKYANVVEWVADCLKYNALVKAYLSTSNEFKAALAAAEYYMAMNISGDDLLSRAQYSVFFEEAYDKYAAFLTDEKAADLLFKSYFTDGIKRVEDVFGSAIAKNVVVYFSEGLGIPMTSASWLYACVEAYKIGWKISEAITDNGTDVECRELSRACYYLEDAMVGVVEASAVELKNNQSYQAAKNFDAAYTILQNMECYALNTYVKYLNAQQCNFSRWLFHGFDNEYNMAEIEIAKVLKLEWQNACCHKDSNNSKRFSGVSIVKICCPTDVFVYDNHSNLVLSIENNAVTRDKREITASVVGSMKVLTVPDIADYRIEIKATDDGTMSYVVDNYDASDLTLQYSAIFENVQIKKGNTYTGTFDNTAKLLDNSNGNKIDVSNQVNGQAEKELVTSIKVKNNVPQMKVEEKITLEAKVTPADAYCSVVNWSSSDENIATVNEKGEVTAVKPGRVTIQCAAIDGSQVCSEIQINVSQKELPFIDVHQQDWFYDAVAYVNANNLMTGLNATTFGPAQSLARAQFAIILHRMNGTPEVTYTDKFPDVPDGIWFTDAILWASSTGVVTGYTDTGKFGPADNINREQMAVMMYRYANYKGYDTGTKADFSKFSDASKVSGFAEEAMQWAVGTGIITGKDNGTRLDPQGNASRAECATIIMRFVEKYN
ncbi:MAG: S-layer homology domain-containing protein [Schaedlerella sp.]|nr:S-layer homology domain-containing protein [Lachnospiraceae bacterium]MDY4202570.1 S-layer homology domain-containing protein [Schaedlerella sp.]